MRVLVAILCVWTLTVSGTGHAHAQVFDLTFDQFRKAFDQKIRDDTLDKTQADWSTTKMCKKVSAIYTCAFSDKGFQSTVTEFKRLDVMNGKFNLKLTLTVETVNGRVSRVRLNGDRSDPVNLLQFASTVANVMQMFEPDIVEGEGKHLALAKELGLMRGDADPTVGQPKVLIKPYAAVKCLVAPSAISVGEACEWVPRS